MLKKLSFAAALFTVSALASQNASAVSFVADLQTASVEATDASVTPLAADFRGAAPEVIMVAGGCGWGFHRGPWGGCRVNWSPAWPCHFVHTGFGPRRVCR